MASKDTQGASLLIVLDLGGTGTKCIYGLGDAPPISLWIEPEVIPVTIEAVEDVQSFVGAAEPENSCWLGYNGQYVAIGYLAQRKFWGNSRLAELKIATAPWKALAALWIAAEKLKLGSKFEAVVWALLPGGEMAGAEQFEKDLKLMAAKFETPTGPYQIQISSFECLPEGAGVFLSLTYKQQYARLLKQRVLTIAMIGYRNASVLLSWKGVLDVGGTSALGMDKLVSLVANKTGADKNSILGSIVSSSWNLKSAELMGGKQENALEKAIKQAQQSYWSALRSWLLNTIPEDSGMIIFCGGTADYLKPMLEKEFGSLYRLDWHAQTAIPTRLDTYLLGNRLADAYGVYTYLIEEYTTNKGQTYA
ncbi:ParM/StbA family protein [Ancylothrix sp. C2]|uniref:ParM/StbA family protein n=1 Tax=Ancylothrix sp. D3o TaxID=2953691 RepID=UPI0021BB0676|nr:ParM/StbA family protein [Ancylothrix sp. D3o]MCT7953405.1 ParM/StbA family protein [Ancylothrix sp. D3o]